MMMACGDSLMIWENWSSNPSTSSSWGCSCMAIFTNQYTGLAGAIYSFPHRGWWVSIREEYVKGGDGGDRMMKKANSLISIACIDCR